MMVQWMLPARKLNITEPILYHLQTTPYNLALTESQNETHCFNFIAFLSATKPCSA